MGYWEQLKNAKLILSDGLEQTIRLREFKQIPYNTEIYKRTRSKRNYKKRSNGICEMKLSRQKNRYGTKRQNLEWTFEQMNLLMRSNSVDNLKLTNHRPTPVMNNLVLVLRPLQDKWCRSKKHTSTKRQMEDSKKSQWKMFQTSLE